MVEHFSYHQEIEPETVDGIYVSSHVELADNTEIILGHDYFGDFTLQGPSAVDQSRPNRLYAYHSVEPAILSHVVWQIIRSQPPGQTAEIVDTILDLENQIQVGPLRYPGRDRDASIDRQYDKTSHLLVDLLATNDQVAIPRLAISKKGSLNGYLNHQNDGIVITDEQWDDDAAQELSYQGAYQIDKLPRREIEIVKISNSDLPNFAAALIASARTDYGRVKHSDMILTLKNALAT